MADSLDKRREDVRHAFLGEFDNPLAAYELWVVEVFDDHIIVNLANKYRYYSVPYMEVDGKYQFAMYLDWTEVEEQSEWVEAMRSLRAAEDGDLIYFGEAVKMLDNGHIGGYLVRFSSPDDPDLTGDYFTKDTDFRITSGQKTPIFFNHRMPIRARDGKSTIVIKKQIGEGELTADNIGIFIDAILYERTEYEKAITKTAIKQGWSSGTAAHLVDLEPVGNAMYIKTWPLGLDASITPTPAEPRNNVVPLKSLTVEPLKVSEEPKDALAESAVQDGESEPEANGEIQTLETPEGVEVIEMELTKEEITALVVDTIAAEVPNAVASGVEQAMKSLPAMKTDVKVVKDEADQPWEHPGQFFQAVKSSTLYGQIDPRLLPLKATGMSEGVPADGGYLLAPQIAGGILEKMHGTGQLLARVANDPVGPNSNSMLYNYVNETSRADGSRFGGLRGYWLAEGGTKTASKAAFGQLELKLKKVAVLAYATDELLADAVALESWLGRTIPEELRFQVENAFYRGDGLGKPLGIMNAPALVSVLRIDASEIDATDIANMWSRRWAGYNDYVWLANSSIFPQLINLTVGNFPMLLPISDGAQGDPSFSIYGRPYIEVEYTSALGTTGDLMLCSLSQYQTITKGGIQSASSIHVSFATDETAFRFVYRIDGAPSWNSALTPYDGGNTKSPFVVLATASA